MRVLEFLISMNNFENKYNLIKVHNNLEEFNLDNDKPANKSKNLKESTKKEDILTLKALINTLTKTLISILQHPTRSCKNTSTC